MHAELIGYFSLKLVKDVDHDAVYFQTHLNCHRYKVVGILDALV